MSRQGNLWNTVNATSSPGLEGGPGPCASPGGPMTGPCGPDHALANLSARQAEAEGLLTSGTYGRTGSTSSGSVDLQRFLVSKLRQNLPYPGLTLFKMTWKVRVTPLGRLICALRASGRSISGKGCGSWGTPRVTTNAGHPSPQCTGKGSRLEDQAALAPWQTPTLQDATGGPRTPDKKWGSAPENQAIAKLTHWPTPRSSEAGPDYAIQDREKSGGMSLQTTAAMAGWPTPMSAPDSEASHGQSSGQYRRQMAECAPWPTPSSQGSAGETSEDLERKGAKWQNRKTGRVLQTNLATEAKMLTAWPTPRAEERCQQNSQSRAMALSKAVKETSGPTPYGSRARTGSTGQLNPAFCLWLQGYPPIWVLTAPAKLAPTGSSRTRKRGKASGKPPGESGC